MSAGQCASAPGQPVPATRNVRARSEPWLSPLLRRAMAASGCSVDAAALERELLAEGATSSSDFVGISTDEAQWIWKPLQPLPPIFVREFTAVCALVDSTREARRSTDQVASTDTQAPPAVGAKNANANVVEKTEKAMAALVLCSAARKSTCVPQPEIIAEAIRALAAVDTLLFVPPAASPRQEVARRAGLAGHDLFDKEAVWMEFCGWKASAAGYASAVRLYGQSCTVHCLEAWPPTYATVDAFVVLFRSAASLSRYVSHLRTVLRWLRSPLGALEDTVRIVRGAEKSGRAIRRMKIRATADQTRKLARWCSRNGQTELGESWVVARHFCLRYGEVLQLGAPQAKVFVDSTRGGTEAVRIVFLNRKCCSEPVEVVRRCICGLQGKTLCGACILKGKMGNGSILFPSITYSDSLAGLKIAAQALGFAEGRSWGTHAFRRGWATEVIEAKGPAALFYSGGWRGMTAFAYASAKARGTSADAEFIIEFSDSSGEK